MYIKTSLCLVITLLITGCHIGDVSDDCSDTPPVHDIPFNYTLDTKYILVATPGGDIHVSIGPSGAHNGPHTGHIEGDAKANWLGLYATQRSELTELSGNGDGVCQTGEICGLAQSVIDNGIPTYIAPFDNFTVTSVRLDGLAGPGAYYGSEQHWRIDGGRCGFNYSIGHLRTVGEDLRQAMIDTGYTDPATVTVPGSNLITGDPVVLNKGASLAQPQVVAEPIAGHPGYYGGKWANEMTPWTQIEFFTNSDEGEASFYTWLDSAMQDKLLAMMYAEADDPTSFRYHNPYIEDWLWKAEMPLYTKALANRDNYDDIESHLGDWWESNGGTCGGGSDCDELFVIYPIFKSTPYYSAALYENGDVSYLVHYVHAGDGLSSGEVVSPAAIDPVSGSLLVKWRSGNKATSTPYQMLSYRLSPGQKRLRIRWGAPAATSATAVAPAVPTDTDVCDGVSLTCHDHDYNAQNVWH